MTYLNFVLSSKNASPSTIYEALRLRSKLEVYKFAQAERGMKQVQALAKLYDKDEPFSLQHFFACRLLPRWQLKRMLCDMFVKMGCTKSALDEYLGLLSKFGLLVLNFYSPGNVHRCLLYICPD